MGEFLVGRGWRRAALPLSGGGEGADEVGGDPARSGWRRAALPLSGSGKDAGELDGDPARSGPAGPVVMGVLNVTPDSFSDGGRYAGLEAAVAHALEMWDQGADLVDVGGESTRPGAERVDAETEIARVLPVIRELAAAGMPLSVDTSRSAVAAAVLEAGAAVINDVSGGLADPAMAKVVADAGCPYVIMHWRGHSKRMTELARYDDVVGDVCAELRARVDEALAAGVAADKIIVDPGLGFAKTPTHNWELSRRIGEVIGLGYPVLLGASRKRYLGELLAEPDGTPRPFDGREAATVATSVLAFAAGVWGVRVHEVRGTVDALAVWRATGQPRISRADRSARVDQGEIQPDTPDSGMSSS